jgi:hypothetical protein
VKEESMLKWLKLIALAFDVAKLIELQAPMSGQGKAKLVFAIDVPAKSSSTRKRSGKLGGTPKRSWPRSRRPSPTPSRC